jgi:hypothetical protein
VEQDIYLYSYSKDGVYMFGFHYASDGKIQQYFRNQPVFLEAMHTVIPKLDTLTEQ